MLFACLILLLALLLWLGLSQGPNSCSTGADDSGVGTITWSDPGFIISSNDQRATADNGGTTATTHYLKATDFGFSIPAGSTIDGVVVEWERATYGFVPPTAVDNTIKLVKGGTISGDNKSAGASWPGAGSEAYASFGGASDLWGLALSVDDINASNFGSVLVADLSGGGFGGGGVDHVRITVYYTAAAGGQPSIAAFVSRVQTIGMGIGISH